MTPAAIFDVMLAAGLVGLAAAVLSSPGRVRGAALFIVFGLVMALTWIRLDAPDIALAEAAVGAGLTGVVLLDVARRLESAPETGPGGGDR